MKVAFVIQDLFSQGAEYVTALMVRGFIAKGYEVDLVVSQVHNDLLAEGKVPFDVPEKTNWVFLPSRKARYNIGALRKYLKTTDAHSVVIMSGQYVPTIRLATFGLLKRPQIMYVEHGPADVDNSGNPKKPLTFKERLFSRINHQVCDFVGVVSEGVKCAYAKRFPWAKDKIRVVYNPAIDDVFFKKIASTDEVHPWLQNRKCPTFVAAGAHCYSKNHTMLLEAVKICCERHRIRLVLFGRGDLTSKYDAFIRENKLEDAIALPGYTNNLPLQMKYADGILISSRIESFSVVAVEALASGSPVISTRCPYGPPEILDNGKYGTLVPVNDAVAMAEAILEAASMPKKIPPKDSWKPFALEAIVERYERTLGLNG